ncbi:receptor-like protein kinase 7 [Phoenix dactylifera]|uniref:non-specific serine/threonine protein kinase n=1 Tax=Phoenix dactylifera TaxID=42345 RepID=A0A8B8ZAY7_PHODC|nr:receptor-like protein kinase 7 [Phoenix dactylifera]
MPPSILFYLLLLCLCLLPGGGSGDELQILLDLKTSLGLNDIEGFESWTPDNSPCNFTGIVCNSANSVAKINLNSKGISGKPPFSSLCRLPALSELSLGSNHLSGTFAADIRTCTGLQRLDLAFNKFTGVVPDLSPLNKLEVLNLSDNGFSGLFPWSSLGNLTELVVLSLGDNGFDESPFPPVVADLTKLTWLYLSDTNIKGEIPPWIGNLTELRDLELADNFLTGEIPPEIVNLNKLWQLELYNNSLAGKIPTGFRNLSDLVFFDASMNNLEGDLSELRFLNKLLSLQLFYNDFSGEVPPEFGDFRDLVNLSLYSNRLSGKLPAKLGSWAKFNFIDVSTNFFTGEIPPDMCRLGTMTRLLVLENNFSGEIPASYANCSSLIRFRVSNNSLSGVVPAGIWSLPNVNIIDLALNQFEGTIDAGIGKAKSLAQLFIDNNRFSGELPPEISGASSLVQFDATYNQFSGEIPASIGGLQQLQSLYLQHNSFSGEIPEIIGSCSSLTTIDLASNSLSGTIPATIGDLPNLNSLDLSNNQLSGQIPASLSSVKFSAFNLSNNQLTGPVPAGLAIDAYITGFAGNPGLCSDDTGYLRRCSSKLGGSSDKLRTILTCLLAVSALLLAAVGLFLFIKKRRSDRNQRMAKDPSWDLKSFRILSFDEQEIINSIRQENLIGKGGSGNVYRVELGSGKVVAVKHIWNDPMAAAAANMNSSWEKGGTTAAMLSGTRRSGSVRSREFEAEVTTLSSIRHVNVVKLYCSITSEDASLLVYEHLPNGSLWDRLHTEWCGKLGGLGWETRHEIAVGAARGLAYLHHGWDRPILHRDVKSSNILLDECFKPRIADFGLAKVLYAAGGGDSSAHVIAGTHGYIAPEYAYTWKVNEKSDVYSFGVVLMELVTGRRPIEPEFGENKDIVCWVSRRMNSGESAVELVDRTIPDWEREDAVKVLRVAVLCTARLPAMRPSMRTVVQMLEEAEARDLRLKVDKVEGEGYKFEGKEIGSEKVKLSP